MLLHLFIELCMGCNIASIDYRTPLELACTDKLSIELLKKYFVVGNDYYEYNSNCGYCLNLNCKAYMKSQFFILAFKKKKFKRKMGWNVIHKIAEVR